MRAKRLIIFLTLFSVLLLSSCKNDETSISSIPNESSAISDEIESFDYIDQAYSLNQLHVIWDMKLYDGYLYIGAGDFDKNISPNVAMRLNLLESKWETCGTVPDEQIGRFVVIDGKLMIPGFDPKEDWSFGNYYVLENNTFETYRVLPGGIHCFDLEKHDDIFFAALGVNSGDVPIVALKDTEKEFSFVSFMDAEGKPLSTQSYTEVRAYDFVTIDQTLYAIVKLDGNMQAYKYDNGIFVYHASLNNKLVSSRMSYLPILEKVVLDGTAFLTTGRLYCTDDMSSFSDITPDYIDNITDILIYDGILYALCNTRTDNGYMLSVLRYSSYNKFETVKTISSDLLGMSFAYNGEQWYIAIGGMNEQNHKDAGKIICLKD